jgi:hypothetical protein
MKHYQAKNRPESGMLKQPTALTKSSLARNALHELSDLDLQQVLKNSEGLIEECLTGWNFCLERGFWFEDALNVSIFNGCSAEKDSTEFFHNVGALQFLCSQGRVDWVNS